MTRYVCRLNVVDNYNKWLRMRL